MDCPSEEGLGSREIALTMKLLTLRNKPCVLAVEKIKATDKDRYKKKITPIHGSFG
jgi:mRNA-degrading endonuclease toxin of MazEF toxin-antitoxin module